MDYVGIFRALQNALAIYAKPGARGGEPILDKSALVAALDVALTAARAFCEARGVALDAITRAQGFERIGLIDDAVEAILQTQADKQRYFQLASRVARLFKAILPDPKANELAPQAVLVAYLAARIRAEIEPPDISAVMADVEELLNDSIATNGYRIGPPTAASALVNLSEIDFEALQQKFAKGHKRTEAEKLRRLIEGKLKEMMWRNPSRIDFVDKFQKLLDAYNAGSKNVEELFEDLKALAKELTQEEQRHIAEQLSEEELALFDILTRPAPDLTRKEQEAVKKVCRDLLETLKREKLVLDWREKQQARAGVMQTIKLALRPPHLPEAFDRDLRSEKLALAYAHVFDHYSGPDTASSFLSAH